MKSRCMNPNAIGYKYWGGRGITVCERWLVFENFLADMGERPAGRSLDRINNDGNYEPGNCRWATRGEQRSNTSKTRRIEFHGETHTLAEWSRITGLAAPVIHHRLKVGWAPERALTSPLGKGRGKKRRHAHALAGS